MTGAQIILLFTGFIVKHFVCDFVLQTPYQFRNKWRYGHPGGLLHALIHGAGTFLVMLTISPLAALYAALADALVHYHVDWIKANLTHRLHVTPEQGLFWILFGVDQLAHYLTYAGLAAVFAL